MGLARFRFITETLRHPLDLERLVRSQAGLHAPERGIGATPLQQVLVPTALHDAPPLDHDDSIGMAHGAEPVGDHQGGAAGGEAIEGALDRRLGLVVHRRGGLIKDQHRRIPQDGAGQGDALALAAGEALAPLADDRVVAIG